MGRVTLEDLTAAQADLAAAGAASAEGCFPAVWLEREFGLDRPAAGAQAALGEALLGVNAFHVDPGLGNAWLARCEWSERPGCFREPLQDLVEAGLERIFGEGPPGIEPEQFLLRLKSRLLEAQGVVERVFILCVFAGDPAAVEKQAVFDFLREELESRKHLLDKFFGRPVTLVIQVRSAAGEAVGAPAHRKETQAHPLRLESPVVRHGPGGEVLRVGFARLTDIAAMYRAMGARLLERNIRALLAEDTVTNLALRRAFAQVILEGREDPLAFAFDHNGVTLFAEKVEERNGAHVLTEPRLLNGAQTVAVLDAFLKEHAADPRLAAGRAALDEIAVLCKVITGARREFVVAVTLNNNRQNPVRPWNLRANDLIQLEWQDKLREELGLYYERQERAFAALAGEEREELEAGETKAVEVLKLTRTFLAADGELEQLSRLTEVFEDESTYRLVFHPRRLKADARDVVLLYKIQFRLARLVREITEHGEKKYAWLRRARNLVWALLCQGVLNEPDRAGLRERYGRKLGVEPDYTALLARLAGTRVRLAIGAAAEAGPWAAELALERFGGLRSDALYDACMKEAYSRWGWAARTLP